MREIFISKSVLEKLLQDVIYVEDEDRLKAVTRRLRMGLAGDPTSQAAHVIEAAIRDFDGGSGELRFALSVIERERGETLGSLGCLPDRIDSPQRVEGEGELIAVIDMIREAMTDLDRQQIYVDVTDINLGAPMIIQRFRRETVEGEERDVQVLVDFTPEEVERICSTREPHDPLSFIVDAISAGDLRGVAWVVASERQDDALAAAVEGLIADDVLVLCNGNPGRASLLSPEATTLAGEGLRRFLVELGNGISLPPVWNFGTAPNYPRTLHLLTKLSVVLGGDMSRLPMVSLLGEGQERMAPMLIALGSPVIGPDPGEGLLREILTRTAQDVFGGRLLEEGAIDEIERRRARYSMPHRPYPRECTSASLEEMIASAISGARIALMYADHLISLAIARKGEGQVLEYPDTAYGLPTILGWNGLERPTLGAVREVLSASGFDDSLTMENALKAGEAAMYAAEAVEALRYMEDDQPFHGTPFCGFVPDKVLRELGIAFVDDTIPACAVLLGEAEDPEGLVQVVRDCQSRGMLIIAVDAAVRQLRDMGVAMGLDRMLYPVGKFTQAVHGLNFAVRAALSFGNVQGGDRERLSRYLERRPKVFVVQMGGLDAVRSAIAFAALLNGASIITDQDLEEVTGKVVAQRDPSQVVQAAIEARGIEVKLAPVKLPVAYGPAFEGEIIRRPDTFVEAGGSSKTLAYEVLRRREDVEDGRVELIGPDVDRMEEGSATSLAILVDVYGKRMQDDFEGVVERRIHQFLNYGEGLWHTGQRDLIWVRLSKAAVEAGLRLRDLGEILVIKLKEEFGNILSRVQVTIVTDEEEARSHLAEAEGIYAERDARMAGLTDDSVDTFYTCTLCQSFAPDHVCIVTPERLGLCGAVNWLDAKASSEIAPNGPNRPVAKGAVIDVGRGEWEGVNEAVSEYSHHRIDRMCMYSLMESPMTSCGCFEAIVAMTADMQAVIVVNREYGGMTPVGMKFSTLAGSIGGGKQTPGFIGIGRKYITSKKFIPADGGFLRIAWMPRSLKESMREELQRRAEELGVPDMVDRIADEEVTTDAAGLMEWMASVDHPALRMPPLL